MLTNKKSSTISIVLLLILMFFLKTGYTQQNLIANPSFETYIRCPKKYPTNFDARINLTPPWYSPVSDSGYFATYYNSCADPLNCCSVPFNSYGHCFQYARTGNAFVGMYFKQGTGNSNFRNYIQTKLLKTLQIAKCYYVEFFVNAPDNSWAGGGGVGVNNIGLLLTDTAVVSKTGLPPLANRYGLINASAQISQYGNPAIIDTANWVKIAGVYTAKGGEQYITIGSFVDDAHTVQVIYYPNSYSAGYNIDDVSVIPLDSMQLKADAGRDTTIVKGDSVWIGSRLCGLTNVIWYDAGNNVIDTGAPGLWVKPTSNTFYVIEQDVCGQYSRDTVFVNVQALPVTIKNYELKIKNRIQRDGVENVWETASEINVAYFNVQRSLDGVTFETVGTVKSKGASKYSFIAPPPPEGVIEYFRLEVVDKNGALSYSEVKELRIENGGLIISPNPAKDFITIHGGNVKAVSITDVSGRVVLVGREKKVDVRGLLSGVYYLAIETLNGDHFIQKFIKLP